MPKPVTPISTRLGFTKTDNLRFFDFVSVSSNNSSTESDSLAFGQKKNTNISFSTSILLPVTPPQDENWTQSGTIPAQSRRAKAAFPSSGKYIRATGAPFLLILSSSFSTLPSLRRIAMHSSRCACTASDSSPSSSFLSLSNSRKVDRARLTRIISSIRRSCNPGITALHKNVTICCINSVLDFKRVNVSSPAMVLKSTRHRAATSPFDSQYLAHASAAIWAPSSNESGNSVGV
mmetsp:Transcript_31586/g.46615  ORF Transcript_31586/g.46615 Transcript_31586/m.46615 type:complete len:234 (+) Transcript_31586:372-1073(+)